MEGEAAGEEEEADEEARKTGGDRQACRKKRTKMKHFNVVFHFM